MTESVSGRIYSCKMNAKLFLAKIRQKILTKWHFFQKEFIRFLQGRLLLSGLTKRLSRPDQCCHHYLSIFYPFFRRLSYLCFV